MFRVSVIEVKGITKKYFRKEVLKGVSFYVNAGECVGIIGANGCGKTTLLSIMSGSNKATSGSIIVDGENPLRNKRLFSKYIGYVPQENPLMEDLSVRDNLMFWYSGTGKKADKDIVNGTAKYMGLEPYYNTTVAKLSGGLKKRLSITCAIANEPKVLIMDEPGASLDIVGKQDVWDYMRDYKENGGTIILTSHEESELRLCDRMYFMNDGGVTLLERNVSSLQIADMIRGCEDISSI